MPENSENSATPTETLQGFARCEVFHRPKNGKPSMPELVEVRQLTVRDTLQFFREDIALDPASQAELYTGKPKGWSDSLVNESVYQICEVGRRVNEQNFPRHLAWLQAQAAAVQKAKADMSH